MKSSCALLFGVFLLTTGCSVHKDAAISRSSPDDASAAAISLSCKDFPNGVIPEEFSGYGQGLQPHLTWTGVPTTAKSLVALVEDPDAPGTEPFIHWLVINIPPDATSLPDKGTVLKNSAGDASYYPPKPPAGSPHHYHFELFALSNNVPSNLSDWKEVENAIKGKVLAKGELVATYEKK